MPTIFSHAIAGLALGSVLANSIGKTESVRLPVRFWVLTIICPVLPDADVISFTLGIPYRSTFGHRGFSHSGFFALLVSVLIVAIFFRTDPWSETDEGIPFGKMTLVSYFFLATLSHALLDALTNGGLGVALLSPLSNTRFFFPLRPILVSPIGTGFFSEYGMKVLGSEILWIWLPSFFIAAGAILWRRLMKKVQASGTDGR
jgi:inner membrane protein